VGLSFSDFAATSTQLVIIEASLKYLSPAKYGDEIKITGTLQELRAASVVLSYELINANNNNLIATASTKGAFISAVTNKPIRIPELFLSAFTQAAASDKIEP
jgi:acyl-CoA thioester hydrolase